VKAGKITEAEINRSLERLFVARFRLGMFDPAERVPFSRIPISENDSNEHRQLARIAEREAIVLLKNQGGLLPLSPSMRRIAVVGPSADDPIAVLGNYHGISSKQVTPLQGIERQFSTAQIRYALGATYAPSTPALVPSTVLALPNGSGPGAQVEYFDNPDLQGQPKLHRTESRVYLDLNMEDPAVLSAVGREKYSVRWTGTLTPPATGEYTLAIRSSFGRTDTARVFLDNKKLDFGGPSSGQPTPARRPMVRLQLTGGRRYAFRMEAKAARDRNPAGLRGGDGQRAESYARLWMRPTYCFSRAYRRLHPCRIFNCIRTKSIL
jgi:beta-glucosidase